jgi:hypothetical protein
MTRVFKSVLLIAATATVPGIASAQEAPATPAPFVAAALDEASLGSIAGREDVNQVSKASQIAGVSQNSVGNNSVTGEARIADNAFQNMSGLSILNVNTGNNVAINAAMNVNISILPGQ